MSPVVFAVLMGLLELAGVMVGVAGVAAVMHRLPRVDEVAVVLVAVSLLVVALAYAWWPVPVPRFAGPVGWSR